MLKNEFESRVQQQLEEFKIRPSAAVWEKVEEALRKKKKRPVVFFIFILAGLSLAGYWGYVSLNHSKPSLVQQNTTLPGTNKPVKNDEPVTGKENSPVNAKQDKKEDQLRFEEENLVLKGQHKKAIKKTTNKLLSFEAISKATISQPVVVDIKNLMKNNPLAVFEKSIQKQKDNITNEIAVKNEKIPVATNKKKRASKINWGIDLAAGISSSTENIFGSSYNEPKTIYPLGISVPGNTSRALSIVYPPSPIQPGPAFRVGLVGELQLSKKSSISSGLQYAYASNSIQVGTYTDTPISLDSPQVARINSFYRGFSEMEYTNRYHFIQLPLQYHLQLNKGVKLPPIRWSIGASAGYLFKTNGLVYDEQAGGIYYRDNAAFNKIQFHLTTGFSFHFGSPQKIQWSLGPELSVGMTKLMKNEYDPKQYLLSGGISGRIFFGKKK